MTPIVWVAVILGVVIVALAVGIPYYMTHRRMNEHIDHGPGEAYLEATGRTREDLAAGRAGHTWRRTRGRKQWQADSSRGSDLSQTDI
jgi:hypothetical protein